MPIGMQDGGAIQMAAHDQVAQQARNNSALQPRIEYNPDIHGNLNAFESRSPHEFQVFKEQYTKDVTDLLDCGKGHLSEPVLNNLIRNSVAPFLEQLFGGYDHYSTKEPELLVDMRDRIVTMTELLSADDAEFSELDITTSIHRAFDSIHMCSDGAQSNVQSALRGLQHAGNSRAGEFDSAKEGKLEAYAQRFAQQNNGRDENFAGNEIHYANVFRDYAIEKNDLGVANSGDGLVGGFTRGIHPYVLDQFASQIEVSVTPRSIVAAITEKHHAVLSGILQENDLPASGVLEANKLTSRLQDEIDINVMSPLKKLIRDETQAAALSLHNIAEPDESYNMDFSATKKIIRTIVNTGALPGAGNEEMVTPRVTSFPSLANGAKLFQENTADFIVVPVHGENRRPTVADIKHLPLHAFNLSASSDLAEQILQDTTSGSELIDFAQDHLMPYKPPMAHYLQRSSREPIGREQLRLKLTDDIQERIAASPQIRNNVLSAIGASSSKDSLKASLRLVGEDDVGLKAALLARSIDLMPRKKIPKDIQNFILDPRVLYRMPASSLAKLLTKTEINGEFASAVTMLSVDYSRKLLQTNRIAATSEKLGLMLHEAIDKMLHAASINPGFGLEEIEEAATPLIKMLVREAGADVNAVGERGNTLLIQASILNNPETVDVLVAAGAIIDQKNDLGNTALMIAAECNNTALVEKLLSVGAELEITNSAGMAAYNLTTDPAVQALFPPAPTYSELRPDRPPPPPPF